MSSVNKAILIGNVGGDPESKTIPSGKALCSFRLATSRSWKDESGNKKEQTEWHSITCWGKLAEIVEQYVGKGDKVYVEGRLETQMWEKDGQKRYKTHVVADTVTFLTKGSGARPNTGDPEPVAAVEAGDDLPF